MHTQGLPSPIPNQSVTSAQLLTCSYSSSYGIWVLAPHLTPASTVFSLVTLLSGLVTGKKSHSLTCTIYGRWTNIFSRGALGRKWCGADACQLSSISSLCSPCQGDFNDFTQRRLLVLSLVHVESLGFVLVERKQSIDQPIDTKICFTKLNLFWLHWLLLNIFIPIPYNLFMEFIFFFDYFSHVQHLSPFGLLCLLIISCSMATPWFTNLAQQNTLYFIL